MATGFTVKDKQAKDVWARKKMLVKAITLFAELTNSTDTIDTLTHKVVSSDDYTLHQYTVKTKNR